MTTTPPEALAHARGSFMEADLPILWETAVASRPPVILELGTGWGLSTRTLAHAARSHGGIVITVDPEPTWTPEGVGGGIVSIRATAEAFAAMAPGPWPFVYVDVDPHTYDQTRRLIELYSPLLAPGGVMLFHDVIPARPEIEVRQAVEDWLSTAGPGWSWAIHPGDWGTGILRRPGT